MKQLKGARLLSATMNMRKYLNRLTSRGDLTQGEYQVLRHIRLASAGFPADGKPSPVRAATLSDKLELSRPSITRILNTLERRGFIIRKIDREDRRSITIELTEKGGEALDRANKALLAEDAATLAEAADAIGDDVELLWAEETWVLATAPLGSSADRVQDLLADLALGVAPEPSGRDS